MSPKLGDTCASCDHLFRMHCVTNDGESQHCHETVTLDEGGYPEPCTCLGFALVWKPNAMPIHPIGSFQQGASPPPPLTTERHVPSIDDGQALGAVGTPPPVHPSTLLDPDEWPGDISR